ncbi:MAG TPA: NAD(P)-binding domain-containing protein, partial [bacterium]
MAEISRIQKDGALILKKTTKLPDVLDVLIVGGGPGGTACAFRAKELGFSTLVIDFDDLMKRIRDYPKEKDILPDFGGGDKMKFPKGDKIFNLLHFPPLDKDEMVKLWRNHYFENNVPAKIGIELTGLERSHDLWKVKTWNHNLKAEEILSAKHVVIAMGRGVPRRFDIPGNTDGIAYRLSDPADYVTGPALVIGGGTSAAEAVIAISNAKAKAKEPSAIYWAYRGAEMPKISKALAEVFFDAYVGNGNIRYHPHSEPSAIVLSEDRKEYLSLRIDRKQVAERPSETT